MIFRYFRNRRHANEKAQAEREARAQIAICRRLMAAPKRVLEASANEALLGGVLRAEQALSAHDLSSLEEATAELERLMVLYLGQKERPAWRESALSITWAVVIALLMRAFLVEAFKIPSGSMIPSLAVGDQIFVNKLIYGPRIPYLSWRPMRWAAPKRGDVVVFVCPQPPHEDYIKRIVGVAGDVVSVRNGVVAHHGEPTPHRSLGRQEADDRDAGGKRWFSFSANAYADTLGQHQFVTFEDLDPLRRAPDFGPLRVPEGHVMVMGDNRDHSYDSRAWGMVPEKDILGKAMIVWWSWGKAGLQTSRLGTLIP